MAYEDEKNRLANLLQTTIGITRVRDNDLEREATERAAEARQQTGMNFGDWDGVDLIAHPTAAQRSERLGTPATVYTAELATWNYLYNDPVLAASAGLLNSAPHRTVLDNRAYTHWGIGIYTEIEPGETRELLRRWWFILWFSTKAIGAAAVAAPSEVLNKKVSFTAGTHIGYRFGYDGRILASKSGRFAVASQALAKGRGRIPAREGAWLLIANGAFTDMWVQEDSFVVNPHPLLGA